jgi:hypothetical protein
VGFVLRGMRNPSLGKLLFVTSSMMNMRYGAKSQFFLEFKEMPLISS